jgi:N-acetylmuramoyl-L-alanine amidase
MRRAYTARWGRILAVWVAMGAIVWGLTTLVGCDTALASEYEGQELSIPVMTLIAEAGGEPDRIKAMQAVGNVIRNRSKARGLTVDEVCLQPWQFSCWNDKARLRAFIRKNRAVYEDALTAWQLSGVEDVTGGADHYHTKGVNPRWNRGMKETVVIANHRFFKS